MIPASPTQQQPSVAGGDSFVFEGEQGTLYQIDVTIDGRPLSCCVVTLYDADGEELDRGEDSEAVRIFWEAESTGRYHVIVENDRLVGDSDYTPTFTLTLATR